MDLFWYVVGVCVSGAALAAGLIFGWYWLIGIGLIALPLIALWGMVSSGPGSPYNPYHH